MRILKNNILESNGNIRFTCNRLLHASTGASSVALVSGISTIGTSVTIVGFPISASLHYPKTLIVDDGKEFYGDTTKLMEKHDVIIQRGDPSQHHSQGIVERFNRTLVDRLFTYQYHKELEDPSKSNREWVSRLQNVVSSLNNEKTRLIGMNPADAIKQTLVEQGFSQPAKEYEEKLLDVGTKVRYLYEPGELEGYQYKGERRK